MVYAVTVTTTGMLDLLLDSAADLGFYVRTACDIPESDCVDDQVGDSELLRVPMTEGDVVYVLVDGFAAGEASLRLPADPHRQSTRIDKAPRTGSIEEPGGGTTAGRY